MAHAYKCDRCGVFVDHGWYDQENIPAYKISRKLEFGSTLSGAAYNEIHLCPDCVKKLEKWLNTPDKEHEYKVDVYFKPKHNDCDRVVFRTVVGKNPNEAECYVLNILTNHEAYRKRKIKDVIVVENEEATEE